MRVARLALRARSAAPRRAAIHDMDCPCPRCPANRVTWEDRWRASLAAWATAFAIILLIAACGGPSPLVLIGK